MAGSSLPGCGGKAGSSPPPGTIRITPVPSRRCGPCRVDGHAWPFAGGMCRSLVRRMGRAERLERVEGRVGLVLPAVAAIHADRTDRIIRLFHAPEQALLAGLILRIGIVAGRTHGEPERPGACRVRRSLALGESRDRCGHDPSGSGKKAQEGRAKTRHRINFPKKRVGRHEKLLRQAPGPEKRSLGSAPAEGPAFCKHSPAAPLMPPSRREARRFPLVRPLARREEDRRPWRQSKASLWPLPRAITSEGRGPRAPSTSPLGEGVVGPAQMTMKSW